MIYARAAWTFLRGVPWQVYAAILLALAVWWGVSAHSDAVSALKVAEYNRGVKDATDAFNKDQAKIDAAQRSKVAASEKKIDLNNREIVHDYLTNRDTIGARADALRVRRREKVAGANPTGTGDVPFVPDAACLSYAAAEGSGLSFEDTVTSLMEADLNTTQLIALQKSINDAAAVWATDQRTNEDAGTTPD